MPNDYAMVRVRSKSTGRTSGSYWNVWFPGSTDNLSEPVEYHIAQQLCLIAPDRFEIAGETEAQTVAERRHMDTAGSVGKVAAPAPEQEPLPAPTTLEEALGLLGLGRVAIRIGGIDHAELQTAMPRPGHDEIRAAYLVKCRELPQDSHPREHAQVLAAYQLLCDADNSPTQPAERLPELPPAANLAGSSDAAQSHARRKGGGPRKAGR